MADLNELARLLKELDDNIVNCMKCGMCQAVCPVFAETGREADVARGKVALIEGLANEMLKDPEGVEKRLNRCLLCGTCEANCPSGVKITDIFLKARAILTGYFGLSPAQKLIFRGLLSNPALFNTILGIGSKFQGLFTKEADDIIGSSCSRFNAPVIGERHFKVLAEKPFSKIVPKLDTPAGISGVRVAFFPGCVVDKIYPEVGEAVLKALKYHGVGVYMPAGQACCGIPAIANGEPQTFEKLVQKNVDLFDGQQFDYIITPCATCTSTIKKVWPMMIKNPALKTKLENLASKAMDISQFLVDVLGVGSVAGSENGLKVTYHDPCHLRNSLGVTAQPREVLKSRADVNFVEMTEAAYCCGSGGSFNLKHYDLSKTVGERKANNVKATGADVVATSCPACMMQLTDMLSQQGTKMQVKHAVEIYVESLG